MTSVKAINNLSDWHKERLKGIGASEASAVIGSNPYMTNQELWMIKTGQLQPMDISDKPYVQYGVKAEDPLREIFKLDFPEYNVEYKPYDLVRNSKYDWIFATLDGRLTEKETGRKGILEIKTTEILKSMQKEKWKDKVPENYYIQILHQLLATGYEFAILKAQLKYNFDGNIYHITKHYKFERSDVLEDLKYLLQEEKKFWKMVQEKKKPNLILPSI